MARKFKLKVTKRFTKQRLSEIEDVRKKSGLTPETLLDKARSTRSSLHDLFEWDDSIAGRKYRKWQSRYFVNKIKVIYKGREFDAYESIEPLVIQVSDKEVEKTTSEYTILPEIVENKELSSQMIETGKEDIIRWARKYSIYKYDGFKSIIKLIFKLEKKWESQKQ